LNRSEREEIPADMSASRNEKWSMENETGRLANSIGVLQVEPRRDYRSALPGR